MQQTPREDVEVRVHRLTYENPLVITLIIFGLSSAVGAVVLGARRVNAGLQEIRRTNSETGMIQAGYKSETKKHEFSEKLYDRLAQAMDEEDEQLRHDQLRRLQQVASVAAGQGLVALTHNEVSALEANANRQQPASLRFTPPRQLEI